MADAAVERLALIEVVERDGRVRQQLEVQRWPLTIGRGFDRDLVLEDPHVAAAHATLDVDADGRLWLHVGDTLNGVRVGRRLLRAGERRELVAGGPALQIGQTRLRLRRAGDPLPPERALAGVSSARTLAASGVLTLALWALLVAEHWIASDPPLRLTGWLPVLVGAPAVLVLWCAGWAMASKLFQHRFEFGAHWALAVRGALAVLGAGWVLHQLAAALGWPLLFRWVGVVQIALAAGWLFRHARLVLPGQARVLGLSFVAAFGVGVGVMMVLNQQRGEHLVGPLYMHQLPQPHWRLARPQTPHAFVERALALKPALDARAATEEGDDAP